MFNWFDKIRKQPLSKRRLVAFSITLLFTGVLFLVWLSVWLPDISRKEEIAKKVESFTTPKDNFFQSVGTAWQGITEQYSRLKDALNGIDVSKNLTSNLNYQSATDTLTISVIEVSATTSTSTISY